MIRRLLAPLLLAVCAGPLAAQVEIGDRAWVDGRFAESRAAYERELEWNPHSARSLYRLALLASWDNRLDSALALIGRARMVEPADPDLRLAEARILAWDGRFDAATAAYRQLIAVDGDNAEALVGLGRLYYWRGDERRAMAQLDRALTVDPGNADGLQLRREIVSAGRPVVELAVAWSDDSEKNTSWSETLSTSVPVASWVRAFASAGLQQSTDARLEDARRSSAEAGLSWGVGRMRVTAAAGARRLTAGRERIPVPVGTERPGRTETSATYRADVSARLARGTSLSVAFAHYALDETAVLIEQGYRVDALDASLDAELRRGLTASLGAGGAWIGDGNARTSAVAALTLELSRRFFVGGLVRTLGYETRGTGYFSPERFTIVEGRGGYNLAAGRWEGRLSGGAGVQTISGATQGQWHVEARLGHRLGLAGVAEAFGAVTNSVANSTTGADRYRHRSAGVRLRIGL